MNARMPAKRRVHNRVAAARARQRCRVDQCINHRAARAGRGKPGGQQNAIRFQLCLGAEPQREAIRARIEFFNLTLMQEESAPGDGLAERASDVMRDGTLVARLSDQSPSTVEVSFGAEAIHKPRTEPARIHIELVLTQGVARDEMDMMSFLL